MRYHEFAFEWILLVLSFSTMTSYAELIRLLSESAIQMTSLVFLYPMGVSARHFSSGSSFGDNLFANLVSDETS